MYLLRALSFVVIAVGVAQGMLIDGPDYVEETIKRLNIGSCHKKLLEKLPSYKQMRKSCMPTAADAAGIYDFYENNDVPDDTEAYYNYVAEFAECKLEYSGAMKEDYVDFDAYIEFLDLPDPDTLTKNSQKRELEMLIAAITICREESYGDNPVDIMINFDRCIEMSYRDYCEVRDKQIGIKNDLKLQFLSFNTPSKCPNVRMPEDDFQIWLDCADTESAEFSLAEGEFDINSPEKMDLVSLRVCADVLPNIEKCFYQTVGMSPPDYVASLDGWEDIPQKGAEMVHAMHVCGPSFGADVDFEAKGDGYDDRREFMAKLALYTDCLSPRLNRICGMNSDVALIVEPPLNSAVRDKVYSIVLEKTGYLPISLIKTLKVAVFEP